MSEPVITGFRLSGQQERVWSAAAEHPAPYRAEVEIRVSGKPDLPRLQRAIRAVVARHEILRTRFERQAGLKIPFQVIHDEPSFSWQGEEQGVALRVTADEGLVAFSLPALCADRRTLRNLVAEIAAFYADPPRIPAGEVLQYPDVVQWQEDLLSSEDTRAGRDFWRRYCKDLDFAALDTVLAAFEQGTGAFEPAVLEYETDVRQSAAFFLTCWCIFLSRITNRASLTIGCEFDGRKYDELAGALGLFAKVLPVEIGVPPEATFGSIHEQVKAAMTDAGNWQESFVWEKQWLLPLAFESFDAPTPVSFGAVVREEIRTEPFRLKLAVSGGRLAFHYDSSRLPGETVARWAESFQVLLRAAQDHPETPAGHLPLLTHAEREKLLFEWNRTDADYPRACFHELFEEQAARTPERAAVRSGERELSYRELNERANQLAHALEDAGLAPNSLIALCLERGVEMIAALLGIFKAGGAYVPLSADLPKARLAQQLAGTAILVTERSLAGRFADFAGPVILMDDHSWQALPSTNTTRISTRNTTPEDLAYAIYTSGSTGTPKAVAVRHRNLVNYATFIARLLKLGEHPEGLHFATVSTLSADLGNTCIYPSLLSGGCLHVIPHDADFTRLPRLDVLKIVPSHLAAVLDSGVLPRRYLILGGEALSRGLLEQIEAMQPGCEVINHYGPTETTVGSLTLALKGFDWKNRTALTIPIGRPIANTRVYILDAGREPVPQGVTGELYISGAGVSAGYLNQPERTAERFSPDPFSLAGTMYRTGDLARYLPDGNVEFLGRIDDQVKIRGYRIELGDVEAALSRHPSVKQAAAIASADSRGDKRLVAYVAGDSVQPDELRAFLKEQLPEYMIPPAIFVLKKLPLTANGKIDRRNLPDPEEAQAKVYVAPRTATEASVAAIWGEVLRRERIGVEDNFFDLGGHSLLATQVISRMRRDLKTDPPLRILFEAPTVAGISEWIDRTRGEDTLPLPPPILRVSRDQPLPLSFAQQRLWVSDRLTPGNPAYNIARALRIRGALNVEALGQALNEILRRHESQRTTFSVRDGQPVQVIAGSLTIPLPVEDLSGLPESHALDFLREESVKPFDLERGPLVRARLLRLAKEDHVLVVTAHHIITDAWSAGIFLRELGALYASAVEGKPSPLPDLLVQYADYAAWQRQWLQGEVLAKQLEYWRGHLAGAPAQLELPVDRPRSQTASSAGALAVFPLALDVGKALRALGQEADATLFMTMLAGYAALLFRYSGQQQMVLGTDVANRTTTEAEALIGFFVNMLPLRLDLSGDPTFRELLGRVRGVALGAYAHQDMPFEKLVEELRPERSAGYTPLVQAQFVMQNIPAVRRELAGVEVTPFAAPITHSKFDLSIFIAEREDALTSYWVYRTDLFDHATIERMCGHFENILRNATAQPDARLSAIEMFSPQEKQQREEEERERKRARQMKLAAAVPETTKR